MKYCTNCGSELKDDQDVCLNCGKAVQKPNQMSAGTPVNDTGGFGWGLLGFCVPVVGLILFLVWNHERPRTAKAAGIGALVSVIISAVIYIIYIIFFITFFENFNDITTYPI